MHNFINRTVYFKESGIDQRGITDTPDDRHLGTAYYVGIKTSVFYQIFNARNIFF